MIITIIDILGKVIQMVLVLLIIDLLAGFTTSEKKRPSIIFGKLLCIFCSIIFMEIRLFWVSNFALAVITIMSELVIYSLYILIQKRVTICKALSSVFAADMLLNICAFISAFGAYITLDINEKSSLFPIAITILHLYTLIPVGIMWGLEKRYHMSALMMHPFMQYAVIALGFMNVVATLPMRVDFLRSNEKLMYMLILVLGIILSWAILWTISRYFSEKEKAKILADNKNLSAKLHRTKEFFPALVQTIQKLQTEGATESLQPLIDEMQELCEIEIQESKNEDMEEKRYMPTGVQMLDELITAYGKEAARKDITFDMYAGVPADRVLKEKEISAIDFVRIVGDLTRNAFRAIDRGGQQAGAILLTMGYVDGVFELDVYDNGMPFSEEVLEKLGEKGNTEGGTGYGLADVLNCLEGYQCSFKIEEFNQEDEFTKSISIFWDKKNARLIETSRNLVFSDTCILKKIQ